MTVRDHGRALFTDMSLDPVRRMGVGAYLVIPSVLLESAALMINQAELQEQPVQRRFECTSSTTLEVETVIWALQDHCRRTTGHGPGKLQVYTDSQCISGLLKRRAELTARDFVCRGTGLPLRNASLYGRFYELHDKLDFGVIKLKGHTNRGSRDAVHEIFSYLDRQVRKALRLWMHEVRTQSY